jgi:hypothetical protein
VTEVGAAAADRHLARLAWAFGQARTNDRFWPARKLAPILSGWARARAVAPHAVPAPAAAAATGMPPWRAWTELLAERGLCAPGAAPAPVAPVGDPADPRVRLAQRLHAQALLAQLDVPATSQLRIAVRRVEEQGRRRVPVRAWVQVGLDRIESDGLLLRLTADLAVDVGPGAPIVFDSDPESPDRGFSPGEALRSLLTLVAALPAPVLLVRLAELSGVTVERVARGIIGPSACLGLGCPALAPSLKEPDSFALALRLEELAPELTATVDQDFLADDALEPALAALPPALRGFRGFRDLRLYADSATAQALSDRARRRGTTTLVHTLRGAPDVSLVGG